MSLAEMVTAYLERAGFETHAVHSGTDAVAAARTLHPDVVVLDLGLPGLDGVEVCRQIRTFTDCYVIMTTARTDEVDTLIGLSVGADDYLAKPFSLREMTARVQTMMRRPRTPAATSEELSNGTRSFGTLQVDPVGHEVRLDGEPVALTPTERDLLITLASRPTMAFTRRQLIDEVWGGGWVGDEHLVDVHVAHLRRKLGDDPDAGRFVTTVRGVGYRMGKG